MEQKFYANYLPNGKIIITSSKANHPLVDQAFGDAI